MNDTRDSAQTGIQKSELSRLLKTLRVRHPPQTAAFDDTALFAILAKTLEITPDLEITEDEDICRFVAFNLSISKQQKQSKLIEGVVKRILANTDWPADKRLAFLEKHVQGRRVSRSECDLGQGFVPENPQA